MFCTQLRTTVRVLYHPKKELLSQIVLTLFYVPSLRAPIEPSGCRPVEEPDVVGPGGGVHGDQVQAAVAQVGGGGQTAGGVAAAARLGGLHGEERLEKGT